MANQEWGKKRTCQSCGASFYDLGRKNIECPKCRAPFDLKPPTKRKRPLPAAKPEKAVAEEAGTLPEKPEAAPAAVIAGDDKPGVEAGAALTGDGGGDDGDAKGKGEPVDDEEKRDELIEDTSDLGQDDDDMSEVKEHIDDGVEDKN